jgi:CelD/BcsL family acetyltransferase involved in cellulose biosynthesis
MEFKRYDTFDALASYKQEWDQLLQKSASFVPFLTYDYMEAWWRTRGGGEWPPDSPLILIAAFEDEHLVGIAPLFHAENVLGDPVLMFVGAIEVSDFLDFIVEPETLPRFISGLIDFLLSEKDLPEWELLDLYNLLEDSPTLNVLQAEANERGWVYEQVSLQPSPYIPLPDDFNDYMEGIDGKQRREIRRKLRNLESSFMDGALVFTDDPDRLYDDVDAFLTMMAQDPNKRDFLTDAMRQHLHNIAQVAFENGWLQLAFFTIDGERAAGNMSFNFNKRLWLYNSGWEWEYREFSPGWLLLTYLIEWATENGIQEFDFMRGDEDYKYKFGGVDRHVYRATLKPQ